MLPKREPMVSTGISSSVASSVRLMSATMGAGTGMSYKIERWFNGQRAGAHVIDVIGSPGPGRRSNVYTDRHVPPGLSSVQYQVTPIQRGGIGNAGAAAVAAATEAGFRESYVQHLVGPDSMVVGTK